MSLSFFTKIFGRSVQLSSSSVQRSPTLGALVSTKTKCIKLIFIGKIALVPVAFLMTLSIIYSLVSDRTNIKFSKMQNKINGSSVTIQYHNKCTNLPYPKFTSKTISVYILYCRLYLIIG